jgi:hypothetical protein
MLRTACEQYGGGQECYCILNAVFTHDSDWANAGVGKRLNNPGNVRCLSEKSAVDSTCVSVPGNGQFAKFSSIQLGIEAAVDLWNRSYRGLPADVQTYKWARTHNGDYYNALRSCYP